MTPDDNNQETFMVYADYLEENGFDTVELRDTLVSDWRSWNWDCVGEEIRHIVGSNEDFTFVGSIGGSPGFIYYTIYGDEYDIEIYEYYNPYLHPDYSGVGVSEDSLCLPECGVGTGDMLNAVGYW